MSQKTVNIFFNVVMFAVILGLIYFSFSKKTEDLKNQSVLNQTATSTVSANVYKNNYYGFSVSLPDSWEDYSIITDEWEGYSIDSGGQGQVLTESGPMISIRYPDWDYKSPRQDIPIMVFTLKQWDDLTADKFHIGAAPIGPSELGRNSRYVFALPARYNFSFLTGFEEVEQIIKDNTPLKTF